MRVLVIGSLNIDRVYKVDHFVQPGETISSESYNCFAGGKGLNQSVALARAGAAVLHAGRIGSDGLFLKERLESDGVDTSLVDVCDEPTGHAVIQVDSHGENCIIVSAGANRTHSKESIGRAVGGMDRGDIVLLQNETNLLSHAAEAAHAAGLRVAFNPAPMDKMALTFPLEFVNYLIVNRSEGKALSGCDDPESILAALGKRCPDAEVVVTLGADGAMCAGGAGAMKIPARKIQPVDTTAAGDTFIGYYLAAVCSGQSTRDALTLAAAAAAMCATRPGAADSIPRRADMG